MGRQKWEYGTFYKVVRIFLDTRRTKNANKKEKAKHEQAYPSAVMRKGDCPNLFYRGHCPYGKDCRHTHSGVIVGGGKKGGGKGKTKTKSQDKWPKQNNWDGGAWNREWSKTPKNNKYDDAKSEASDGSRASKWTTKSKGKGKEKGKGKGKGKDEKGKGKGKGKGKDPKGGKTRHASPAGESKGSAEARGTSPSGEQNRPVCQAHLRGECIKKPGECRQYHSETCPKWLDGNKCNNPNCQKPHRKKWKQQPHAAAVRAKQDKKQSRGAKAHGAVAEEEEQWD